MRELSDAQLRREMNAYWDGIRAASASAADGMRSEFRAALKEKLAAEDHARRALTKAQADSMSLDALCQRWRTYRNETALESMSRRNLLPSNEIALVRDRQIAIGMSLAGMQCALGKAARENRTVTASNVRIQHIYGSTYVYTENGVVTAWQDSR